MGANDDSADHPDNQKLEHQGWSDIKEMKRGFVVFVAAAVVVTVGLLHRSLSP